MSQPDYDIKINLDTEVSQAKALADAAEQMAKAIEHLQSSNKGGTGGGNSVNTQAAEIKNITSASTQLNNVRQANIRTSIQDIALQKQLADASTAAARAEADYYQQKMSTTSTDSLQSQYFQLNSIGRAYGALSTAANDVGNVMVGAANDTIRRYVDLQDQLQAVRRTTLDIGADATKMNDELMAVIDSTAIGAERIASIAEALGAGNINASQIKDATEAVAIFEDSTGVKGTADELVRIWNLTKDTNPDQTFKSMANSIFVVANESASAADEVSNMVQRLAPMASIFDLTSSEIIGMGSTLASFGIQAQAGGTSMQRSFAQISKEIANGGERLELMARLSGTTAEGFAKDWSDSPVQAFAKLLEGMKKADDAGGDFYTILGELGLQGQRDGRTWAALAANIGEWQRQMGVAKDAMADGNEMFGRQAERMKTVAKQLEKIQNNLDTFSATSFANLLPAEPFILIGDTLETINGFLRDNPGWAFVTGLGIALVGAAGSLLKFSSGILQARSQLAMLEIASLENARAQNEMTGAEVHTLEATLASAKGVRAKIVALQQYIKTVLQGSFAIAEFTKAEAQSTLSTSANSTAKLSNVTATNRTVVSNDQLSFSMKKSGASIQSQTAFIERNTLAKIKNSKPIPTPDNVGMIGSTAKAIGGFLAIGAAIEGVNILMQEWEKAITVEERYKENLTKLDPVTSSVDFSSALAEDAKDSNASLIEVKGSITQLIDEEGNLTKATNDATVSSIRYGSATKSALYEAITDVDILGTKLSQIYALNPTFDNPMLDLANSGDFETAKKNLEEITKAKANLDTVLGSNAFSLFVENAGYGVKNVAELENQLEVLRAINYSIMEPSPHNLNQQANVEALIKLRDAMAEVHGQDFISSRSIEQLIALADKTPEVIGHVLKIEETAKLATAATDILGKSVNEMITNTRLEHDLADGLEDVAEYAHDAANGFDELADKRSGIENVLKFIESLGAEWVSAEQRTKALLQALGSLTSQSIGKGDAGYKVLIESLTQQIQTLYGVADRGTAIKIATQAARGNLALLQEAIAQTIVAKYQLANDNAAVILSTAAAQGNLDTLIGRQKTALALKAALAENMSTDGMTGDEAARYRSGKSSTANKAVDAYAKALKGLKGAYSAGAGAAKDFDAAVGGSGGSAGSAAKQIKKLHDTILDYASTIKSTIDAMNTFLFDKQDRKTAAENAFSAINEQANALKSNLRDTKDDISDIMTVLWGKQNAADGITSSISDLKDEISDALEKWKELNAELSEQRAEESQLNYWLSVARAVGDVAEEQRILAQLEKNRANQANTKKDMVETKTSATVTATGNSQAAIDGRKSLQDLAQSYLEYVVAMGKAGASQAAINSQLTKQKAEFMANAKAIGFSVAEATTYAKIFDQVNIVQETAAGKNAKSNALMEAAAKAQQDYIVALIQSGASQKSINKAIVFMGIFWYIRRIFKDCILVNNCRQYFVFMQVETLLRRIKSPLLIP